MRKIVLMALFAGLFSFAFSQEVSPFSGLKALSEVPQVLMPYQDNKALLSEELALREPGRPQHFAVPLSVNINPATHGLWETVNGTAVWRLRIFSEKAKSLNLGFAQYLMPEGAAMLIYSPDQKKVMGPFTPADNEVHEQLWTPILHGEELVIEVQIPVNKRPDLGLELKYVNHDFIGFGLVNASGSCNLDVICGAADGWPKVDLYRDIIQAAGAYHINGISTCSGALINNARNDCTPYYLTADHCGISNGNAASVVVYWNYQNSVCRQPNSGASGAGGDGNFNQFNTGAIFRAGYGPSDFTLIELDDPLEASHNPFLAGWNAMRVIPDSMIGIHHPGVEEKRISFDVDPGLITGWASPQDSTHVQVSDWDVGTTEGGSSGSPLFDQDKRIIGQLTGGGAACGNNLEDQYGWMAVNWDGGGTPTSRLKDWLDPDNLGILFMDGKSCAYSVTPLQTNLSYCASSLNTNVFDLAVAGGFATNVNLVVSGLPAGLTSSFNMNPVAPGDTAQLTVGNLSSLASGSYDFWVIGSDGIETDSSQITLNVFTGAPSAPTLASPSNGQNNVTTVPQLSWTGAANSFEIEIATDSGFTNVVEQGSGLTGNLFTSSGLNAQTKYYWRVRGENNCGNGTWAATFDFTTDNIACANYVSNNIGLVLPGPQPGTVSTTLNIVNTDTITDVNVSVLRGTHTWISDLEFIIISPSGTQVTVIDHACDSEDDFDLGLDDQASAVIPCPFNAGGDFLPDNPLSAFNGEVANGTWTLEITDTEFFDDGILDDWELQICTKSNLVGRQPAEEAAFNMYPNPANNLLKVELAGNSKGNERLEIWSANGQILRNFSFKGGSRIAEFDLSNLPAGLYLAGIRSQGRLQTQRLVIQR